MRPASESPSRPRRRAFALVVTLLATFGAVTACSDDGPPTPAISGENPADVTLPTLPPTTTTAGDDTSSDTSTPSDTTEADGEAGEQSDTDTTAPTTTAAEGDSDSPDTVPST